MRLLIIEDNIALADSTKLSLEKLGYTTDVAYTGNTGEEKAFVNSYNAILLDFNLPDKDGIEILKFLRGENIQTPVKSLLLFFIYHNLIIHTTYRYKVQYLHQ